MNIGINITNLYPGKIGGAEQYVRNVIREMGKEGEDILYLMVNSAALPTFEEKKFIKICHVKEEEDRDTQLNYYIDYYNINIIFSPLFFVAPNPCRIPSVASILDVQHEFFPQYFEPKVLRDIRKSTKQTLEQVDGIITISNYSKETIIDKYQIASDKIVVTYLNSDGCFDQTLDETKKEELKLKIGSDYIFYPANTWPHKNHINLLKAFNILKQKEKSDLKLVFTGDSKNQKGEIEKYIADNHLLEDVMYLGYIPQGDMPYIFANAKALVFPSVFEGFGIPLVEAMKAGVAIACSDCGSIPEVAEDAALYFNAYDPEDIADKLYNLLRDNELREMLIKRGIKIAQKYSWKKCADDTRDYLYKIFTMAQTKEAKTNIYENEYPLVSIVTPSYNQGKFIEETIKSVLGQDYPNIEYIVIDGGSSDETVSILQRYDAQIRWYSEKDNGQADAVNKGIRLAKGKIIGWLNSDDTYLPNAVSKVVTYLKSHPDTDLVYGEGYYTDIEGKVTNRYFTEKYSFSRLAEHCIICQPTAFFTKAIVQESGMLDVDHQLSMDYELWMRIAKKGKISYIPEYLATSRMYEDNKTLSRREEVYQETCNAVKKHYGYVPISWIDGYTDYVCKGSRGVSFCIKNITLFLKYNIDNMQYCKREFPKILKNRLLIFRKIIAKKEQNNFKGKYEDNWLSTEYKKIIEDIELYDKIIITINNQWPLKKQLKLKVFLNGKLKKSITLNGNGMIDIEINIGKGDNGNSELVIRASKTFCPAVLNGSSDNRQLSCQLDNVRYIRKDNI